MHDADLGFVGGLLIVNRNARPLEFHCTAPIQPKPAQSVLYGATLNRYLLEEQIPQALVAKTKARLDLILTNQLGMLNFRDHCDIPVGVLAGDEWGGNQSESDSSSGVVIGEIEFSQVAGKTVAHRSQFQQDRERIEQAVQDVALCVEVDEPFERLSIAIQETCKSLSNAA